jgi:serine protease Do
MTSPDTTVNLKVQRDGSQKDVAVKLGELPTPQEEASNHDAKSGGALEGVQVENLDSQTAKELGLPSESKGVVVTDVSPSSPVAETGLRRGDVIQEVNHQPVKNVSEFEQAMKKGGKDSLLLVNRRGNTLFLAA